MVIDVTQKKEVSVKVANKIGLLAEMSELLADHGINIEAIAGYGSNGEAEIMVVVDDARRAVDVLKKKGYPSVKERDILLLEVENKPGAMKNVARVLEQEEINIEYIYGTAGEHICPERIVLSTSDDARAQVIFKKAYNLNACTE